MPSLIDTLKSKYQNKKILVVGLGLQGGGAGTAAFFAKLGAHVTVTDLKSKSELSPSIDLLKEYAITYHLGTHDDRDFLEADLIMKGPSVPWSMPQIQLAIEKNISVDMETSFFLEHSPAISIGISGTRGKSTTSHMIYQLMKDAGRRVFLGGNIPLVSTINFLDTLTKDDVVILELSSWQLSGFHRKKISPHIALITNLYPDHLNYYKTMEEYWHDKTAIYQYQTAKDILILNKNLATIASNDHPKGDTCYFTAEDFTLPLLYLPGEHNKENAAAALSIARKVGIEDTVSIPILSRFKGLPFRQEIVGEKDSILFVNDTTSTTPTATEKAIRTFVEDPIILIVGGNSKKLPLDVLLSTIPRVTKIILLPGSFTEEIKPHFEKNLSEKLIAAGPTLSQCVEMAYEEAKKIKLSNLSQKIIILFSPAATSFAQFKNEFDRGQAFNQIVKKIIAS